MLFVYRTMTYRLKYIHINRLYCLSVCLLWTLFIGCWFIPQMLSISHPKFLLKSSISYYLACAYGICSMLHFSQHGYICNNRKWTEKVLCKTCIDTYFHFRYCWNTDAITAYIFCVYWIDVQFCYKV